MRKTILITGKSGFIGCRIRGGRAYHGRIENEYALMNQARGMKGIVHLAAKSDKRICEHDPKSCILTNLWGLCNVLEVAYRKKIWVLFISTFQVRDKSLYGLSKLMGEELCRIYQKKGVKVRIARLPIVYGPRDKSSKVITKIINELKAGKRPKINTRKKMYWLYVDDVAKVIEHEVDVLDGKIGKKYSLQEVVDVIWKCL